MREVVNGGYEKVSALVAEADRDSHGHTIKSITRFEDRDALWDDPRESVTDHCSYTSKTDN